MDFLKWYKNTVETIDEEPPEFIWGNIQNELDINQVWSRIDRRFLIRKRHVAAAIAVLILLISGAYWHFNKSIKQKQNLVFDNKPKLTATNIIKTNTGSESKQDNNNQNLSESTNKPSIKQNITKIKTNNFNQSTKLDDFVATDKKEIEPKSDKLLTKLQSKKHAINYNIYSDIILTNQEGIIIDKKEQKERIAFRKLYTGSALQLANTWLLNEKTNDGLESSSLTTSKASFGYNVGFFVGTNLAKHFDLHLDLNIFVQNNQDYGEYRDGYFISNSLKFNYSQIGLSVRYYFISNQFMQGEHGINLGGYWAYLRNATQILNGAKNSLVGEYTNYDYGIYLAYEYIIPLNKKLGIGIGAKGYYGLQNIYAGTEYIPDYLNKTNNASVNISLSLKYMIK